METELTTLHKIVIDLLDYMGVSHEDERLMMAGGHEYRLDCYLPDYFAYIEADGPAANHSRTKSATRDANLMRLGMVGLHLGHGLLTQRPAEEIMRIISPFLEGAAISAAERRKKGNADAFNNLTTD